MQSNNYVVIQGWMCNELSLKGNELLIFAMIHGFSQDGVSKFQGGRKYIADTFNISLPTVDKALQSLVDKQYLNKEGFDDFVNPNVYWVNFEVIKKLYTGGKETLHGGGKETLHNNLHNNKKENKKVLPKGNTTGPEFNFGKSKPQKQNLYSKCLALIDNFTNDTQIRIDLTEYLNVLLEMKVDGYNLYINVWKGLLKKLNELSTDPKIQHKIISQSIERGYKSFYPIKSYYKQDKSPDGLDESESMTEQDYINLKKVVEERKRNGLRTSF